MAGGAMGIGAWVLGEKPGARAARRGAVASGDSAMESVVVSCQALTGVPLSIAMLFHGISIASLTDGPIADYRTLIVHAHHSPHCPGLASHQYGLSVQRKFLPAGQSSGENVTEKVVSLLMSFSHDLRRRARTTAGIRGAAGWRISGVRMRGGEEGMERGMARRGAWVWCGVVMRGEWCCDVTLGIQAIVA